jgi:hypothetical protein
VKNIASVTAPNLALAKAFARRLGQEVEPQLFTVTLFGSRARGDADEESDLDLFVVLEVDTPCTRLPPSPPPTPPLPRNLSAGSCLLR